MTFYQNTTPDISFPDQSITERVCDRLIDWPDGIVLAKVVPAAVALTFFLMTPSHAATVSIDDFDTTGFQSVGAPSFTTPSLNPNTSVFSTADAIGDVRTITVERTSPMGTTNPFGQQIQAIVIGGNAAVSLGAGTDGFAVFSWDAGGADLVDGTNDSIVFDVLDGGAGTTYTLDFDGFAVTQAGAVGEISYDFSEYGPAVDFTNVFDISLTIAGPTSFDLSFDSIRAEASGFTPAPEEHPSVVPLPATGLLFLGALGAIGALRARRTSEI